MLNVSMCTGPGVRPESRVESGVCVFVSCGARVDYGVSHVSTRAVKTLTNHLLISVKHQKHLNPFIKM